MPRVTLTQEVLAADRAAADAAGDGRGAARARAQMRELADLPDGLVIERTQAAVVPPRDPGCELMIFDERFRPRRLVGRVDRRRIITQKITWTAKQLANIEAAEAMMVALALAVTDAERA